MHFKALCKALVLPCAKRRALTKSAFSDSGTPLKRHLLVSKTLLIMRFMAFLLLGAILQVSAKSNAQSVTLTVKDAPLEQVFRAIRQQTGYSFVYNDRLMKNTKSVTLQVTQAPLDEVLQVCFKNQPLTYAIVDKIIVVKPKETPKLEEAPASPVPPGDIQGFVTSENGPIAGASVVIKRTKEGVSTNGKGEFKISGVNEDDILVISSIGYQNQEVPVKGKKGFVLVTLKIAVNQLDELHVLAYGGMTSRRLSTGSVARVSGEDIAKQPVNNVLQALEGRVAGMSISQTSGIAGADVTFNIRGQNSLSANAYTAAPLVIIDGTVYPGIPINLPSESGTASSLTNGNIGYGSTLYNLNPSDIESIEVLKDADATAIYGARAANGVLLVTTKKGKQGKTKVDINAYSGVALNVRRVELLNTDQYRALRKEAFGNAGVTPDAINAPDLFLWDSTKSTDWQKELAGQVAHTNDANLSMSGGNNGTSFLISGNYHDENTIFIDRRGSSKGGAHFSVTNISTNGRFGVSLTGMVNFTNTTLPVNTFANSAFTLPSNWQPYDTAGNLIWTWNNNNPYALLKQKYSSKTLALTSNLNIRYSILPGLDAKVSIGYTRMDADQHQIQPQQSYSPAYWSFIKGYHYIYSNRYQSLSVEPQLQLVHNIAKGKLDVLAGSTIMKNTDETPFYALASNFSSDAYINNWALAGTFTATTGYNAYQYASFFSRANYNWDNKYILNASFRRDGSSRFGPNHRFGNFGAVAGAWLFSKEKFAQNLGPISFGKLRGSIGWVGSDNVDNYAYFSNYSSYFATYSGASGLIPSRLDNPDFRWESTSKLEGALELGFLKDRILFTAAWFRNRTANQLVGYPVSGQAGFTSYTANLNAAVVENKGWELELNTINVQSKNFRWTTSFNITLPQNKLLKFDGIEKTSYASNLVVGKPLNSIFAVHFTGVDSNGKAQYQDANKNGTIDFYSGLATYGKGDKIYVGKGYANCFGGITNTISYKGFQLDFTFQYTQGLLKKSYLGSTNRPGDMYNLPVKTVQYYRDKGLAKSMITSSFSADWMNYIFYSDAPYEDASFIRLTNAALSYNVGEKVLKASHLAAARVYLQAQNLFVIANYHGFDPESGGVNVPPLLRVVGGIQVSF